MHGRPNFVVWAVTSPVTVRELIGKLVLFGLWVLEKKSFKKSSSMRTNLGTAGLTARLTTVLAQKFSTMITAIFRALYTLFRKKILPDSSTLLGCVIFSSSDMPE